MDPISGSLAESGPASAPLRRLPRAIIVPKVLAHPEVGITAATTFVPHACGDPGPVSLPSSLPPSASLRPGCLEGVAFPRHVLSENPLSPPEILTGPRAVIKSL